VALSIPVSGTGLASQVTGLRASALIFTGFAAAPGAACLISLLVRRPSCHAAIHARMPQICQLADECRASPGGGHPGHPGCIGDQR